MSLAFNANLDFSKFKDVTGDALRRGLYAAGTVILDAANNNTPKPPIWWGVLRGSASITVNNGLETAPIPNNPEGVQIYEPSRDGMDEYSVRISYNTAYALRLHESPNWKPVPKESAPGEEANVGNKWLEIAFQTVQDEAVEALAEEVEASL